jgi:hypothetical protein
MYLDGTARRDLRRKSRAGTPRRHATAHFHETTHPLISSIEPGEDWSWCYVEEKAFVIRFDD